MTFLSRSSVWNVTEKNSCNNGSQHSWLFDTFYRLNKFNLISGIEINDR